MSGAARQPGQKCTDAQFIAAFKKGGARLVAETYGIVMKNVYLRRRNIERERGITLTPPSRTPPVEAGVVRVKTERDVPSEIRKLLLSCPRTVKAVSIALEISEGRALDGIRALQNSGANVFERGDHFSIEKTAVQLEHSDKVHTYRSCKAGTYRFGVVTDNHLCSKYAREDVLGALYDWFEAEGLTRVYNAGNWIDGEARFNRQDLLVFGMQNQVDYFVDRYPQRPGITTYFVAGDDHEGWYVQREGVDIGRLAELCAAKAGRKDLRYLGYMEAFIRLEHAKTGEASQLMVCHPGGGSSYAISYQPQKIIESLQGGEKPAVAIFGHYHKMDVFNYRNVWIIQAGTTEDQTPFMRKKRLEAHVGGLLVELKQDEKGAIISCKTEQRRWFDRGYYTHRFGPTGAVHTP